ncbi:hypothetical protein ACQCSI_02515, partial [Ralstonia pseudosolanacearum]
MRPTLVMRSLAGVAVIAIAALSYWIGVQRLHASRAEAAVPHSGQQAVAQSGLPDGKGAADARAGHRSDRTAAKPATADAQAQPATVVGLLYPGVQAVQHDPDPLGIAR